MKDAPEAIVLNMPHDFHGWEREVAAWGCPPFSLQVIRSQRYLIGR